MNLILSALKESIENRLDHYELDVLENIRNDMKEVVNEFERGISLNTHENIAELCTNIFIMAREVGRHEGQIKREENQ